VADSVVSPATKIMAVGQIAEISWALCPAPDMACA
jgi:hypothetical protein